MNRFSHIVRRRTLPCLALLAGLAGLGALPPVHAQNLVISDNFTGAAASQNWIVFDGACLTAGNGSGTIPGCFGNSYYTAGNVTLNGGQTGTLPDTAGNGALRFTNNTNYETGAILSNFTFPSGSGIAVTFSTVTYGGTGADGIAFFLMDGSVTPTAVGGSGGALGYSCSNGNGKYDGLVGAYIGLGIDEFGNFLNASDNTSTGNGFQAGRIGLRGSGSVSWAALNAAYPSYYPSSFSAANRMTAVQTTCKNGKIYDFSRSVSSPTAKANIAYNYNLIPGGYTTLSSSTPLYTSAKTRPAAKPITYQLKITQDNLLSLSYSYNGGTYQPVLTGQSIAASNGTLPSTLRFGFSGSTGGSNNIHEVMCFQAVPATQSGSAASVNVQPNTQVRTGTQVYLAGYQTTNWSGQLTSQNLLYSAATGLVSTNPVANWDGSCVLTGGTCTTTTATTPVQAPAARTMLTWGGSTAVPFQYNSLTTAQQNTINQGDLTQTANRVNFLRGDRTNETVNGGTDQFRTRTSVLGDIMDSGPAWVGPPSAGYGDTWADAVNGSATMPENAGAAQKYSAFVTAAKTRLNVVYSGANDGFLHGFRTGAYDAAGTYLNNAAFPNDGREVIAYMPAAVFAAIHSTTPAIDYANPQYSHAYSVNAIPYTGDLFYANAWHTWLVGGLGAGGAGVYALDVTDPTQFSEANAASLVKVDLTAASIACSNVTNCGAFLGNTFGTPQIRRFHNGKWGFVFGNGLNSTNGVAGIYVLMIDPTSQAQTVYFLSTGSGGSSATANNGITFTTPADLDGDHVVDYVYAGDIKGNMWRFDLLGADPALWAVSQYGRGTATPLFVSGQPISTKPVVAIVPANTGNSRVMVDFGTGYRSPQTTTAAATYATGTQSLYGIWDWDMANWNSRAASTSLKASLAGPVTVTAANLQAQTISTINGQTIYRTVTSNPVCWSGSTDCSANNNKNGWAINFPATSEQLVYSPVLYQGALTLSSTIPANNTPLNCATNSDAAGVLAISPSSGGAFAQSSFSDTNGNFVSYGGSVVSGVLTSGVGSPSFVTASNSTFLLQQTVTGTGLVLKYNPLGGNTGARVTWQQIR